MKNQNTGYLKEQNLFDKFDMWLNDGKPQAVREWVKIQKIAAKMVHERKLTDNKIKDSLIRLFKRINPEKLTDDLKTEYARLALEYGLDINEGEIPTEKEMAEVLKKARAKKGKNFVLFNVRSGKLIITSKPSEDAGRNNTIVAAFRDGNEIEF